VLDELLQSIEAIDRKKLLDKGDSKIRPEFAGLFRALRDVFNLVDGEWIHRSSTVKRLAKRDRRALREAAENARKAAEGAGEGGEIAVTPPLPAGADSAGHKSHKRTQSKMSDKSFNSSSNYERAPIHEVAEATIRKIQDRLADFVMDYLDMDAPIAWIQGKEMTLNYQSYYPVLPSH
jgi:hypothetical protein